MSAQPTRLAALSVVLGAVLGLASAWTVVGQVATRPIVITLFFSGFGAGAGVAVLVAQRRLSRRP